MLETDFYIKQETRSQRLIQDILDTAGIELNGRNPWDIQVHDKRFYSRLLKNPSLSAGESYMDGWWDCDRLDELFCRIMIAQSQIKFRDWHFLFRNLKNYIFNLQTIKHSREVAKTHYDLDNQLYIRMLGASMAYTCAYWKDASCLDQAQNNKYDLVCHKLSIKPGDNILELGCGWGGFAKFAATKYACTITSVNISEQQVMFARELCAGLPITVHQADYRDMTLYNSRNIQFDKVVSIGMCEHIGSKNYAGFMRIAHEQLKNNGLFLLHTIGNNKTYGSLDPWINKYIFPNGAIPSIKQLGGSMENYFVMEDWHNFGKDYDKTLMAWYENFNTNWPELSARYDQRFYRMWVYYLLSCAGTFRARDLQLWQIVLSKGRGQESYLRVSD